MQYEIRADESVSEAVVSAVSMFEGRNAGALDPLDETIDPQALDTIFGNQLNGDPRHGGRVSFIYGHSRITVENNEYLEVMAAI